MISNFPFIQKFVQQTFVNHVTNMVQNKLNKGRPQHRKVGWANLSGTMHNLNLKNSTHNIDGKELQRTPIVVQIHQPPLHPYYAPNWMQMTTILIGIRYTKIDSIQHVIPMPIICAIKAMKTSNEIYNIISIHIEVSLNVQMPKPSSKGMELGAIIKLVKKIRSITNLNLNPQYGTKKF